MLLSSSVVKLHALDNLLKKLIFVTEMAKLVHRKAYVHFVVREMRAPGPEAINLSPIRVVSNQ